MTRNPPLTQVSTNINKATHTISSASPKSPLVVSQSSIRQGDYKDDLADADVIGKVLVHDAYRPPQTQMDRSLSIRLISIRFILAF